MDICSQMISWQSARFVFIHLDHFILWLNTLMHWTRTKRKLSIVLWLLFLLKNFEKIGEKFLLLFSHPKNSTLTQVHHLKTVWTQLNYEVSTIRWAGFGGWWEKMIELSESRPFFCVASLPPNQLVNII